MRTALQVRLILMCTFVAAVVKSFDTVNGGILDGVLSSWGCTFGSDMPTLSSMLR